MSAYNNETFMFTEHVFNVRKRVANNIITVIMNLQPIPCGRNTTNATLYNQKETNLTKPYVIHMYTNEQTSKDLYMCIFISLQNIYLLSFILLLKISFKHTNAYTDKKLK